MTTPTIEQLTARAETAEASVLVLREALTKSDDTLLMQARHEAEELHISQETMAAIWVETRANTASVLTDTAPVAAKIRQEIVDAALERAAWVCDHDKEHGINLLARILAIEIRKLKGKPL